MALVYDQLGNIIGDDGTPDIPTRPDVDAMKYELQQKSTRPQMSIAEAGSNFLGNASNVLKDYEQKLGLTNLKKLVSQIPAVKAVQPVAEVPISLASSVPAAFSYGYVPPGSPRKAYDEAQARAAAIQYQSDNPYTNQILEDLGETFKGMPAYIPTAGAFRPRSTDARVLRAQALATGKEIADIPADFSMAKQGLKRMDAEGNPTFGVSAQQLADEFGDYLERQKSRGKPSVSILGTNDLIPDMNAYIVKGKSAKTWDTNAVKQAEELEAKGVSDGITHSGLGVWKGPDNQWRQEISNYDASVNPNMLNKISTDYADAMNAGDFAATKLPAVLNHTEFFDAYPEAKDLTVAFGDIKGNASYSHADKLIRINRELMNDPIKMMKVLVHELTHHVQNVEGFDRGGNELEFPEYKVANAAQDIETIMLDENITLPEAITRYTEIYGKIPSEDDIAYAERGQGRATSFTHPRDRYRRIFGEAEARTMSNRIDIKPEDLQKYYPLDKSDEGLDVNLKDTMLRIPGSSNFVSSGQFKDQGNSFAPTVAQMKYAVSNPPSNVSMSVKERGGNWIEANLDRMLKPFKQGLLLTHTENPYELTSDWKERADEIGYTSEMQQEMLRVQSLNQWVDRRLKSYIKNDLGTTKDPIRELADQGITHKADLGEGWRARGGTSDERVSIMLDDVREDLGHPRGGYATTDAGKEWEFATDWGLSTHPAHDLLKRGSSSVHMSPSTFMAEQPNLQKLVGRDPNAEVHIFDESLLSYSLGFDHLIDELRNALDPNFPQHLRLTTKQLERMTVPDAVRLVAKINKYREDLAKKATVQNVAEFRQNFPSMMQFEDGSAWHQLKLPEYKEGELPKGFTVKPHPTRDAFVVYDQNGKDTGGVGYTEIEAIKNFNTPRHYLDSALKEEGKLMGHCVGGYTNDVIDGSVSIFTMRDADGKPHVTIESMPHVHFSSNVERIRTPDGAYDITQIKGKENRGVVPRYRQQVIDFLNSLPVDELRYVEEISNVDAVEPATLDTVRGGADIVNAIKKYVPDLPRFISRDEWKELVNKYYVNNDSIGFKDGGKVRFEDAKLPIRAHNREFETPDLMKARDIGLTGDYQGKSLTLGRQQMRRDFDDASKLKRDMDYIRYSQPMLEGRFNAMAMKDPTSPAYQGMAQYEQPFMGGTAGIGAMAMRTPEEELRLKALQLIYNKQLNDDSSLSGMANFPIDGAPPMVGVQYRSRFADGGAVSADEMKYALMRKHNA